MKFFKILGLLMRDSKYYMRQTVGPLVAVLVATILFVSIVCFALNGIGWIVFKIAGENSALSLQMFKEGLPAFWSFQYTGFMLVVLIFLGILLALAVTIKKAIVKMKNYFARLFKEVG